MTPVSKYIKHGARLRMCVLVALVGCSGGDVLILEPIPNQVAQVGVQLSVELLVLNAAGRTPRFRATSDSIPDLNQRTTSPQFIPFGGSGAYFRWVPLGKDVGEHLFRISAESGGERSSINFRVLIRAGNAAPIFLRPLGSGKTIDQGNGVDCFEVPLQVQDADSTQVRIQMEPPIELGYELTQSTAFTADFRWCPDQQQLNLSDRFLVNFAADDGDGHVTRKAFNLLVRRRVGSNCPGRSPAIEHEIAMQEANQGFVEIVARVSDDIGIIEPPRVYYSFDQSNVGFGNEIDELSVEDSERISGTELDGVYSARVALPTPQDDRSGPDRLFYFIESTDNDDVVGDCDHRVRIPANGFFEVPVVPISDASVVPACSPCQADSECGRGLCVDLSDGTPVCLDTCSNRGGSSGIDCSSTTSVGCCMGQFLMFCDGDEIREVDCGSVDACGWNDSAQRYDCRSLGQADPTGQHPRVCGSSSGQCESGYSCSDSSVISRSGQVATVCVPDQNQCGSSCQDDPYEDNDAINQINSPLPRGQGLSMLKLCGDGQRVDDDYFGVFLAQGHQLTVTARFQHLLGDVDLSLLNSEGRMVRTSVSSTDDEVITQCLEPGFYYLHLWSVDRGIDNQYDLDVELSDAGCCIDDQAEEDDGPNTASEANDGRSYVNRIICPGNEDWYRISVTAGQTIVTDLIFDHMTSLDDLDLFIYDTDGQTNLTPCCDITNGQSADSDEQIRFTVERDGTYYVVVRGYRDAQNDYTIGFEVTSDSSSPPNQ